MQSRARTSVLSVQGPQPDLTPMKLQVRKTPESGHCRGAYEPALQQDLIKPLLHGLRPPRI